MGIYCNTSLFFSFFMVGMRFFEKKLSYYLCGFQGFFCFCIKKKGKNICIRIKDDLFLHPLSGIGSYLDSGMFRMTFERDLNKRSLTGIKEEVKRDNL